MTRKKPGGPGNQGPVPEKDVCVPKDIGDKLSVELSFGIRGRFFNSTEFNFFLNSGFFDGR